MFFPIFTQDLISVVRVYGSGWEFYSWLLGFLCCMSLSMYLLIKAIQTIPIGTAYPIWTGIGDKKKTPERSRLVKEKNAQQDRPGRSYTSPYRGRMQALPLRV